MGGGWGGGEWRDGGRGGGGGESDLLLIALFAIYCVNNLQAHFLKLVVKGFLWVLGYPPLLLHLTVQPIKYS